MRSPAAVEADDTAPVDLIGMKLREVCHEGTLWEGVVRQRETDPSTEEKQYVVELSSSGTSGEERRHIKLTENAVLNQLDGLSLKGMAVMRERKADENNITTTLATNGGIIDFNGHGMPKQRRWTIRYHNEEELVCVDLKTVLRAITRKRRAEVSLIAMDAKGRLMSMECTRVEPYHFPKGETWEERGATKYLGVLSSFAGWEEQRKDILKMNKAITFETALVAPSLRQVMMVQQSCLIARATYPRTVMPADNDSTDVVTASMSKQLHQAMGLRDEYGGVGPPTALLQLSQEVGLGLGAANPASHARLQDARRIIEGLETADDRRAAAIWAALRRTITPDGKTTSPDTDGTTVSRMANLAQYAIVAHQGGGTPRDPEQIIESVDDCPRGVTLPEKGIAEVELNIAKVEDRFHNEMQIALLAPRAFNDIIEEVREDEAKEGDAEYNELLFVPWDNEDTKIGCDEEVVGYKDLFAAIGMAKRKKAKIVRVLDMNCLVRTEETIVLDLTKEKGRQLANLTTAQEKRQAAANHEVRIQKCSISEAWLKTKVQPGWTVQQQREIQLETKANWWKNGAKIGSQEDAPYNPDKGREHKTFSTFCRDNLTDEAMKELSDFAFYVITNGQGEVSQGEMPEIICIEDASLRHATARTRMTKGQREQAATRAGLPTTQPNQDNEARKWRKEREAVEGRLKDGIKTHLWVYYHKGYGPETAPGWLLVRANGTPQDVQYAPLTSPSGRIGHGRPMVATDSSLWNGLDPSILLENLIEIEDSMLEASLG